MMPISYSAYECPSCGAFWTTKDRAQDCCDCNVVICATVYLCDCAFMGKSLPHLTAEDAMNCPDCAERERNARQEWQEWNSSLACAV